MENASEELRGELQEDVDRLFEKMNKIEQDKRLSSEDYKLEYDKWCRILDQKRAELKELCWRD